MAGAASNAIENGGGSNSGDLLVAFREKALFMKNWKPGSPPSNRDKLELYALHKQAVSGDAPETLATQTAAERAKYNAWRSKAGLSQQETMRLYLQESDRQIRVYGHEVSATVPALEDQPAQQPPQQPPAGADQPRGLAAIPLLCAAASESRPAYLRRLSTTPLSQAWWARQETLTATPGSVWSLPEGLLIGLAALVERVSLSADRLLPVPVPVVQSFLWPAHNSLLALWMAYILIATQWNAAAELSQTIVWGSRRTGLALDTVWKDEVLWSAQTVRTLTESHQPLTARLVGLALWPFCFVVSLCSIPTQGAILWTSLLYIAILCVTWWYWILALPWLGGCLLFVSFFAGNCFAIMELAGV